MPGWVERLRSLKWALGLAIIDRAAHAFSFVRHRMPDADPARHRVRLVRDVVYGPTDKPFHRLDVYMPEGPGPHPTVMYVHGGGFSMLSKDTHRLMALAFSRRGYVVFNVNYRQGRRCPFPAPLEDAATALVWVHEHAARYGGDPTRLALAGESAGGNLVSALALLHSVPREEPFAKRVFDANLGLRAVISTYPFLDVEDVARYQKNPRLPRWAKEMLVHCAETYLGRGAPLGRALELASPIRLLEREVPEHRLPPFFLACGTRDPLLADSRRMKAALDALGVPCELHVSPGEIHGFDAMIWRPAAREKWRAVHAFLAKHLAEPSAPLASTPAA